MHSLNRRLAAARKVDSKATHAFCEPNTGAHPLFNAALPYQISIATAWPVAIVATLNFYLDFLNSCF